MKLVAFDYSNLVIRHAANPYGGAKDALGRSVNGPVGAARQIIRILDEQNPTHMLIGVDGSREDNVRREIDPSYKAHRPDSDEEISRQFGLAYKLLEVLGWPRAAAHGYEADDVIASAARRFDGEVVIVTGDKDLLALCSDRVRVHLLRPGAVLDCGPEQCREIFGVDPELVCDYKALVGDASDGIKGVRGIGAKSALALLEAHGSLDALLEAARGDGEIEGCKPAIASKLRAGITEAESSYKLAALIDSVDVDLDALARPELPHDSEIGEMLDEMGLSALRRCLPGGSARRVEQAPKPSSLEEIFAQINADR